ncbi:MAG: serine acetyltransferase [Planctomycetes bacterium]|nr:serine acetyltransferase [Planctomycetota bacterium]
MPGEAWKKKGLPDLIKKLVKTYSDGKGINQLEGHDLPKQEVLFSCLDRLISIIFPGFNDEHPVTEANLSYHIGDLVNHIYIDLVDEVERALRYECKVKKCDHCDVRSRSEKAVVHLLDSLPRIRNTVKDDVQKAYDGDPAADSFDSIILSYPGIEAITIYRLAHELYIMKVPLIPRIWSERAHSRTGIDINPGANIGPRFFIDHGTGVVIGETCDIGHNVAIYQGVTLGALAPAKGQTLRGAKRHPTLEDDVIIYAGATILGGNTVIGKGAVIGGNVWLTDSVAPGTKVVMAKADLVFLQPGSRKGAKEKKAIRKGEFACPAKPLCEADGTIKHG